MEQSPIKSYLAVITAVAIWSVTYIFTNKALEYILPISVITLRMTSAVIFLFAYAIISKKLQPLRKRKDMLFFLVVGAIQPFTYFVSETYGLKLLSPTLASVMLSTIPLFAPFFAWAMLHERITWCNILGIVVSFGGLLMLIVENDQLVVSATGLLLMAICIVTAILYNVALRKVPQYYNNTTIVTYVHTASLLFFWPTWLIVDMPHLHEMTFNLGAFISVIALALFGTTIAYILYAGVVRTLGVTRTAAFSNLSPGLTALFVWIITGEPLAWYKWVGIAIVVAGLFVSQLNIKRRRKSA